MLVTNWVYGHIDGPAPAGGADLGRDVFAGCCIATIGVSAGTSHLARLGGGRKRLAVSGFASRHCCGNRGGAHLPGNLPGDAVGSARDGHYRRYWCPVRGKCLSPCGNGVDFPYVRQGTDAA